MEKQQLYKMKIPLIFRQGDPISPLLFVLVMEYMSRLLRKMQEDPKFKHHAKCKKLNLTHLTFPDDILLFSRADVGSVELLMATLQDFSSSTGLVVNPAKCFVYMGAVDGDTRDQIMQTTGFNVGQLPFRYLGVPLSSKKLSLNYYLPLIDKILSKIHHWSTKLLSFAGRVQLVNVVSFAIANYWLQCFPILKSVLKKINSICRTFVWTGGSAMSRKSPISWKEVCKPRAKAGMNIIDLEFWNKVTMMKLLWDLRKKIDNLWVLWLHTYYNKGQNLMSMEVRKDSTWIVKGVMKARLSIDDCCNSNKARPRALFFQWLACHKRLATKEKLAKFGIIRDTQCCFCSKIETLDHLFYSCSVMKLIWSDILNWINVDHVPLEWNQELSWLI
ncbi:uncharacterized protein LOC131657628 [Vicia villosa]|uniref:uncharacterized protein LOC131657628 n=1 Tax=Vicia villosa TaxID=3911 RepID=UPI00273B9699|nr:uncharacterized protein LOC131657628 [Vicia villosa]